MSSSRSRGITLMIIAIAVFSVMDLGLKMLSARLPPLEVACIRGMASLPLVLAVVIARGRLRGLRANRPLMHLFRGLLSVGMICTFSFAVSRMSLSAVYTLCMIAPLLITAVSVPLLGESVRPGTWFAILVGLAGTTVLLRPSATGIDVAASLASLACAACYTGSYVLARFMSRTESTDSLVFWVLAVMAVGSGLLGAADWRPIPSSLWPWILVTGITGAVGQQCITRAFMLAPASVIAPFEYTALVWGALFDWLFWSTHPGGATLAGAALIVGSGVYVMLAGGPAASDPAGATSGPHP